MSLSLQRVAGVLIAVAAAAFVPGGYAQAQPHGDGIERAREHFQAGKQAYEAEDYDRAYKEFEAGYEAEPRPGFLLNMGHAARKLGKLRKARALYQQFLLTGPGEAERRSAEQLVREVDQQLEADQAEAAKLQPAPVAPVAAPPPPVPAAKVDLALVAQPAAPRPVYKRWWFWGAVGVVVLGGAAVAIAASRGGSDAHDNGSWGRLDL